MKKKQRKAILCPNCRRLISPDEPRCPYCGVLRPGSPLQNNLLSRGFADGDRLIRLIVYTNIAMYIITLLFNPGFKQFSFNPLSMLAPNDRSLLLLGATGTIPIDRLHRWWSLIAANYLHGGILHIFFNMVALKQIAPLINREYGTYRMFAIYTLGGIAGFAASYLAGVALTIGASAAVCALIGAALYYGKSRGGLYGQAIYRQIGGWAIGLFVFGFIVPGINNWGHGGGIIGGILLGFGLGYNEKTKAHFHHKLIAGICIAGTLITLGWAVISGCYYKMM
jgi:rhomboid protease GluP